MLIADKDGWINHQKLTKKHFPAIEHAPLNFVNAIVLHRTDSSTVMSVFNAWKTQREGAHFLISESGEIFQTASLKKQCWHVGKIRARCATASSCSDEDRNAMESILRKKDINWGRKFSLITKRELDKEYPIRFPHNHDSLGVEIVGVISKSTEVYEIPNKL